MSDRFARIPARLTADLERGVISFQHYGVMVYLVSKSDHSTRTTIMPSLASLRDGLRWKHSDRQLTNVLHELRQREEIAFESGRGKRGAYVFTVVPADYFEKNKGLNFEVDSHGSKSPEPLSPLAETAYGYAEPRTLPGPTDRAVAVAKALASAQTEPADVFNDEGPDPRDALGVLLADLRDRDDETEVVFRRNFGDLPEAAFRDAHEVIRMRRGGLRIRSEAAFAYKMLADWPSAGAAT